VREPKGMDMLYPFANLVHASINFQRILKVLVTVLQIDGMLVESDAGYSSAIDREEQVDVHVRILFRSLEIYLFETKLLILDIGSFTNYSEQQLQ
jgi:hypothetical protein